jgi:hypothetical protein
MDKVLIMKRLILDKSVLQEPALEGFFRESRYNKILLTDYIAMEMYKGGDVRQEIEGFLSVVGRYTDQVIVLKNTPQSLPLRGRASGMQRRLIDRDQTEGFARHCRDLRLVMDGRKPDAETWIKKSQEDARLQMERMTKDAPTFREGHELITKRYTEQELQVIRRKEPFTEAIYCKIIEDILTMTRIFFENHPEAGALPPIDQLPYTFLFRMAACAVAYGIIKISKGGIETKSDKKLLNDTVDMNYVVFGSYFDGVLTGDSGMREVEEVTHYLIESAIVGLNRSQPLARRKQANFSGEASRCQLWSANS